MAQGTNNAPLDLDNLLFGSLDLGAHRRRAVQNEASIHGFHCGCPLRSLRNLCLQLLRFLSHHRSCGCDDILVAAEALPSLTAQDDLLQTPPGTGLSGAAAGVGQVPGLVGVKNRLEPKAMQNSCLGTKQPSPGQE